ncbi:hypothetical protein [Gloeobacter morelensis]|uniref:Uncharacterized protein n=1 Tax=Gloeobacter morelensis MG652769 TaxID=2781736 RepID=A0ABY3PHS8_9CYAN|nr:hypothetical protein [Gloeobacter morelensis]UFP93205.1 hypothetical protein ISF26_15495 [Gloeobacter morelensis MG652769]
MQEHIRKISALVLSGAVCMGMGTVVLAQSNPSPSGTYQPGDKTNQVPPTTTTPEPGPAGTPPSPSSPYGAPAQPSTTPPSSGSPSTTPAPAARTIDLNSVTSAQLVRAGLDEPSAKLIEQNQPYGKPEDVLQVQGLSEQTKAALKANMDILRANPKVK